MAGRLRPPHDQRRYRLVRPPATNPKGQRKIILELLKDACKAGDGGVMAEELVTDADQRGYHAKAGTLASIRWHLHQMLLAKQVVVTNEPEILSDGEAEEGMIALSSMEAPAGVDRANAAWKQHEATEREFASKAATFVEDYSQNLNDMVAKEAENNETVRRDSNQLQALLGAYRRGQEPLLHTVASYSSPSPEYEAEEKPVIGKTPKCESRGEAHNLRECEDMVPHRNGITADRDTMKNPWLNLNSSGPPYLLEMDREYVQRHNELLHPEQMLMLDAIPEPFIGDPKTAKVVLLNFNPGYDATVAGNHRRSEIKKAIFRNLRHEPQRYPFYAFDPVFAGTGVANYWRKYTRMLQEEARLDDLTFAKRLLVIEWFPYASNRGGLPPNPVCESQKYSFELAKRMLSKQGVQVVGTRSRLRWLQVGQEFSRVPFLNNPQRPWVTRGNMDDRVFGRVIQALTEEDDG